MDEKRVGGSSGVSWIRELPRASVLGLCAGLLAAIQAILGLVEAPVWTRVLGAVVVGAVGAASELDRFFVRRREQKDAEQQAQRAQAAAEDRWQQRAHDCLRLWPAPLMADADPYALGVRRSHLAQRYIQAGKLIAPYVDRDIDRSALKRLQAHGLLLIVGVPASGATRTAYELAAHADSTLRRVLAPQPPHGLKTALDDLESCRDWNHARGLLCGSTGSMNSHATD